PWSGRKDPKGPPDLEEAIRSLQKRLGRIFGGNNNSEDDNDSPDFSFNIGFLALGALLLWCLSGLYIVDEGNNGVETRFGRYIGPPTEAGLNWHIPYPIEDVQLVNVKQQRYIEVGYRSAGSRGVGSVPKEALMLTKDENIIDVRLAVQYQVKDAKEFLFSVANPEATLKQVTESAERGVIGSSNMDYVLTEGRGDIVAKIKKEIQMVMDNYKVGVQITSVNLQDAQPPEQVQGAFEDAIKAREDQQRLINEAEAYANDVIPKARGAGARKIEEAEAYKEKVIAKSTGEVSRFLKLLAEYRKAPEVTRQRLYLEAMESVLENTKTVMVDVKGSNNLLYLPLDKIAQSSATPVASESVVTEIKATETSKNIAAPPRASARTRTERGR
ncbi:MAG: FtsH protease activity modulator HflK, partial [Methylococcales bacterium]|nr:FtsH protease activity modulator HflK [Methylococcales bacterium]